MGAVTELNEVLARVSDYVEVRASMDGMSEDIHTCWVGQRSQPNTLTLTDLRALLAAARQVEQEPGAADPLHSRPTETADVETAQGPACTRCRHLRHLHGVSGKYLDPCECCEPPQK